MPEKSLKQLYPSDEGEELVVDSDDWQELAKSLKSARLSRKGMEEAEKTFKNRFKERMGTVAKVVGPNWSATWKNIKGREVTDWEAAFKAFVTSTEEYLRYNFGPTEQQVDHLDFLHREAVTNNTETKPGYRRFVFYSKKLEVDDGEE